MGIGRVARWILGGGPDSDARHLATKATEATNEGRLDEAVELYGHIVARFASDARPRVRVQVATALFNQAHTLVRLGRAEEAIDLLGRLIDRYAEDPYEDLMRVRHARVNLGAGLLVLNRPKEALDSFDEALRGIPLTRVSAYDRQLFCRGELGRAEALLDLGRFDEAIHAAEAVGRLAADRRLRDGSSFVAAGLLSRASALEAAGRPTEAAASCDELIDRFGVDVDPEIQMIVVSGLIRRAFLESNAETEAPAAVWSGLSSWLADEPRASDAGLVDLAIKTIGNRGVKFLEDKRPMRAVGCVEQAIALADQHACVTPWTRAWLVDCRGVALHELHRFPEALEAFEAALSMKGEGETPAKRLSVALSLNNKANALADLRRHSDALEACRMAESMLEEAATANADPAKAARIRAEIAEARAKIGSGPNVQS